MSSRKRVRALRLLTPLVLLFALTPTASATSDSTNVLAAGAQVSPKASGGGCSADKVKTTVNTAVKHAACISADSNNNIGSDFYVHMKSNNPSKWNKLNVYWNVYRNGVLLYANGPFNCLSVARGAPANTYRTCHAGVNAGQAAAGSNYRTFVRWTATWGSVNFESDSSAVSPYLYG
jgi:hypothetical protein